MNERRVESSDHEIRYTWPGRVSNTSTPALRMASTFLPVACSCTAAGRDGQGSTTRAFAPFWPGDARNRDLGCNPEFSDLLAKELVPWIRREYNVSADPAATIIGGSSYGGLAATCAAMRHPQVFGNVLSQSGSYWWTPKSEPDREPNYFAEVFLKSPKLPIRFYMDAGTAELEFSGQGKSLLLPNRHLRDVLLAKGYEVHYQEFVGWHSYLSWRDTLADGLIALTGSWPKTRSQ